MAARPSTRRSYESGRKFFARFLSLAVLRAPNPGITSPPLLAHRIVNTPLALRQLIADPTVLPAFITFARAHHLRAATVRLYLSAVLHAAASPIAPIPTLPSNVLRLLRACERTDAAGQTAHGDSESAPLPFSSWSATTPTLARPARQRPLSRNKKLPLTLDTLRICLVHLHERASDASRSPKHIFYARTLAALMSVGFFGCLRASEYISPPMQPDKWLRWCDVEWDGLPGIHSPQSFLQRVLTDQPSAFVLTLRNTKTAKVGESQRVRVPACPTAGPLCPVATLVAYLHVRIPMPGFDASSPLFVHDNGRPWSLGLYNANIRAVLRDCKVPDFSLYSSHSLRHGAASTAAANGASNAEVMALGRWASDTFQTYVSADARDARAQAAHSFLRPSKRRGCDSQCL
jgi:hypothetical protein